MNNIDNEVIGKLIQQLRESSNLSAVELSEELGVSRAIVSQWEKGKKGLSIANLCKLAELFNVSVEELVEGKLHDEGTIDYFKRNYDLSSFNLNHLIAEKNERGLEDFLRRCLSIKYRVFYGLLPRWSEDELTSREMEEFQHVKKYASFDFRLFDGKYKPDYYAISNRKEDSSLKLCLKEYFKRIEGLTDEARKWEIDKIVSFNFNIKASEIINLGFEDCVTHVLNLCNQQYKDELLALNLNRKTVADLNGNNTIGEIIDCGGNCVYRLMVYPNEIWDMELLEKVQGAIIEDKERTDAWQQCIRPGFDFSGRTKVYDYVDEWKTLSYADYQKTIMKKRTKYLQDLCNLKYSFPKRYYELMEAGAYDTYI